MHTYNELEFTRVMPRRDGIFAYAKFPQWWSEYHFLIEPNGTIKGQTDSGEWMELSQDFSFFVSQKVRSILKDESGRIYA